MCKIFSKKKISDEVHDEMHNDGLTKIIETASLIIKEAEEKVGNYDYSERNGRHPIFGYINFIVRKYVYDTAFNNISENECRFSSFDTSDISNWFRSFNPKVKEAEREFDRPIYLNNATDPLISSYKSRCKVVNSFAGLGYGVRQAVKPDYFINMVLLLPFGVGIPLDDECHSSLSLNFRGEYKAKIKTIFDFSDIVKDWEYKDGVFFKKTPTEDEKEKKEIDGTALKSLIDLPIFLFAVGKMMIEHGIEWKEYLIPKNG